MFKPLRKITLLGPLCLWAGLSLPVKAQVFTASNKTLPNKPYEQKQKNVKALKNVLQELETEYQVGFLFDSDILAGKEIDLNGLSATNNVELALKQLLAPLQLHFEKAGDKFYYIIPAQPVPHSLHFKPAATTKEQAIAPITVSGKVTDEKGGGIPGVTVLVKGTTNGTTTNAEGIYTLTIQDDQKNGTLVFSFIGYLTKEVAINNQTTVNVQLAQDNKALEEVVVIGYGTQTKESVTGAIAGVQSRDIEKVPAATVSGTLAGKVPGLSFRQPDGRPGAGAWLQIRNMGTPLFVIDGIQKDEGQFNNIAPADVESITILKDASAAVYGSRAANGVVLVTTKKGKLGAKNTINLNAYYGVQNWSRFPEGVNAYQWMQGKAEAEMNQFGKTGITQAELEKWRTGTEYGYRSFNWRDFIVQKNAPQSNISLNTSGGSEKTNYYLSITRLDQKSVFSDEFEFNRTNIQSNIDTRVIDKLKVGVQINGRIETRANPGVPGFDDYWQPRFALFRNRPTERPYANDNSLYPNNISNIETNWALLNYDRTGFWRNDWRVLQSNFSAEYELPIKGLTARGMYSYYFADMLTNTFEYTYNVFTYDPQADKYNRTGGNDNPYRDRETRKIFEKVLQGQLNYNNTFGRHTVGATFVAERIDRRTLFTRLHSVPKTNYLSLVQFADMDEYRDEDFNEARIGYVGRVNYNFADKYYLELAGRRDASWRFAPGKRWGNYPSVSAGWRITEENFYKNLGMSNVLNDFKLRASYGELGDDNINMGIEPWDSRFINDFDYLSGYEYARSTVILDGNIVRGSRDAGVPIQNISWFTSKTADIGADFGLWNGKIAGSLDYFNRVRTGLRGRKYDVLVPNELGYTLPDENVEKDQQSGYEAALSYNGQLNGLTFRVGGNVSYSRRKFLESYKPRFANSWDHYRNSREDRYSSIFWGYEVIGQFQSQEEINNSTINMDGEGNRTLLPGDFIYKDVNGDGAITGYDERPIGYAMGSLPIVNYGLNLSLSYKGFDFTMDFSGGSVYSYNRNWEMRWPYQNTGNLLTSMYDDRWHRQDIYNLDSPWVPGKNPALRFNTPQHSNYNKHSTWWRTNVSYLRMRTMEVGYTVPTGLTNKIKLQKARVFANSYNLFSFDNVKQFGIDPEVTDDNGLQYPQNVLVNFGVNLTL